MAMTAEGSKTSVRKPFLRAVIDRIATGVTDLPVNGETSSLPDTWSVRQCVTLKDPIKKMLDFLSGGGEMGRLICGSACKKDPVSGVIGV
ncbi:hypothetical protein ACGGKE_05110 [Sphingobium naphthae]|uniref:hypothetical protein n=1 Tax=Sphingobium naphthae TaxID=1886786 RepID=UPI0037489DA1